MHIQFFCRDRISLSPDDNYKEEEEQQKQQQQTVNGKKKRELCQAQMKSERRAFEKKVRSEMKQVLVSIKNDNDNTREANDCSALRNRNNHHLGSNGGGRRRRNSNGVCRGSRRAFRATLEGLSQDEKKLRWKE